MKLPSFFQLKNIFFNENACINFLLDNGVFYNSIECPKCKDCLLPSNDNRRFRCQRANCGINRSRKINTFFYGSKLLCCQIMHLGYLWLNKNTQIQSINQTGHSSKIITKFYSHFRTLVSTMLDEDNTLIGGKDIVVEIDETKLGKRKYHRGHRVEGVWLLVGVELTEQRKVFIKQIESRDATTLERIINENVKEGSIIHTDMWKGYTKINERLGFVHQTVNHSKFFKDPITGIHTNTVEGTNNALKISICPRNRTKSIDSHLSEFIWRRINADNLWESFIAALREVHYDI